MSNRCEPPEELRGQDGWHWIADDQGLEVSQWIADADAWWYIDYFKSPEKMTGWGFSYFCPVPTPDQISAQDAEIARLRAFLADIRDQHIGDQPAALNLPEVDWARRCHGYLRQMARAALAGSATP